MGGPYRQDNKKNMDNQIQISLIDQKLDIHMEDEEKRFDSVDKKINGIEVVIGEIRDNHLNHLIKDISDLKVDLSKNSTDTSWLMRFFWIVVTASVGALIAGVINLIFQIKKYG